jgi:hypothetical protein
LNNYERIIKGYIDQDLNIDSIIQEIQQIENLTNNNKLYNNLKILLENLEKYLHNQSYDKKECCRKIYMRLSAQTHPDKIKKPNSKIFQLVGAIYEKITEK